MMYTGRVCLLAVLFATGCTNQTVDSSSAVVDHRGTAGPSSLNTAADPRGKTIPPHGYPMDWQNARALTPEDMRKLAPKFTELFPGVYADIDAKIVEFDAKTSPMLFDDPKAPLFFVETLVCAPDTREHESLLVTDVKPSHLHAAMLAVGLVPGAPGLFKFEKGEFVPVNATGDALRVTLYTLGADETTSVLIVSGSMTGETLQLGRDSNGELIPLIDPRTWLIDVADRGKSSPRRFGTDAVDARHGWVFAGSSMRRVADKSGSMQEVYDADGTGIVIGLCCFGSEVIAWSRTFSPDAGIDAPEWVADFSCTPPPGTKVRVRVRGE